MLLADDRVLSFWSSLGCTFTALKGSIMTMPAAPLCKLGSAGRRTTYIEESKQRPYLIPISMQPMSLMLNPGIASSAECCVKAFCSKGTLVGAVTRDWRGAPCRLEEPQIVQAFFVASMIFISGTEQSKAVTPGTEFRTCHAMSWQ